MSKKEKAYKDRFLREVFLEDQHWDFNTGI